MKIEQVLDIVITINIIPCGLCQPLCQLPWGRVQEGVKLQALLLRR